MSSTASRRHGQKSEPRPTTAATRILVSEKLIADAAGNKASLIRIFLNNIDKIFSAMNTIDDIVNDEWILVEEAKEKVETVKELDKDMNTKTCPMLLAEAKMEVKNFDSVA